MSNIKFPAGNAKVVVMTDAATSTIAIDDTFTIVDITGGLSQAVTGLSLTASVNLQVGAKIVLDLLQGATGRNVAFGSAGDTITAPNLTGVANDRDVLELIWNGSDWVAVGAWFKVVDAV